MRHSTTAPPTLSRLRTQQSDLPYLCALRSGHLCGFQASQPQLAPRPPASPPGRCLAHARPTHHGHETAMPCVNELDTSVAGIHSIAVRHDLTCPHPTSSPCLLSAFEQDGARPCWSAPPRPRAAPSLAAPPLPHRNYTSATAPHATGYHDDESSDDEVGTCVDHQSAMPPLQEDVGCWLPTHEKNPLGTAQTTP